MSKTLLHKDTQTRDRLAFTYLHFQTRKPSMSLSRLGRFDRGVGIRKSTRICNTWIYRTVHENIQEWWRGDSRSKVHTRQGKRSLPAISLFASIGSHVWSHLAWRDWTDLVLQATWRPHFVVPVDGISGTLLTCLFGIRSWSHTKPHTTSNIGVLINKKSPNKGCLSLITFKLVCHVSWSGVHDLSCYIMFHATSSLGTTHKFSKIINVGLCWMVWATPNQMFSAHIV